MTKQLTILVSGATGNQGGAVAHALLERGHNVHALTRNAQSAEAKHLASLGAVLIESAMDNTAKIEEALQAVDGFFLLGNPMHNSLEAETKQGIELANAAKNAGVGHLIYSSVANANKQTGIPHFESKYQVEQHVQTLGIPYTISAPVAFMDNLSSPWMIDAFMSGKIAQALPENIKLQQISLKNIGEFVATLFERRENVFGKRFNIAGDAVTGIEMANILSKTTGKAIKYQSFPTSVLREHSEDMALMFDWLAVEGYSTDTAELRSNFKEVNWQDYSQWAQNTDWRFMDNNKSA